MALFFTLLFCIALIFEDLGYGSINDINTIPGLLACISIIFPMLLLAFALLYIKIL